MKIKGDLIIKIDNKEDYTALTEVSGSVDVQEGATFTAPALVKSGYVDVRQGATFTAPALTEVFYKIGYKHLAEGVFTKGIYIHATPKEIEYLAKLKPIIASNRLVMSHWHQNDNWKKKTADEVINECGTTHCVAGWLQIFEKDKYNDLDPEYAGKKIAPNLAGLFYKSEQEVEFVINALVP